MSCTLQILVVIRFPSHYTAYDKLVCHFIATPSGALRWHNCCHCSQPLWLYRAYLWGAASYHFCILLKYDMDTPVHDATLAAYTYGSSMVYVSILNPQVATSKYSNRAGIQRDGGQDSLSTIPIRLPMIPMIWGVIQTGDWTE